MSSHDVVGTVGPMGLIAKRILPQASPPHKTSHCETDLPFMSTILFDSIFQVKQVNKDGKYFDRGAYLVLTIAFEICC